MKLIFQFKYLDTSYSTNFKNSDILAFSIYTKHLGKFYDQAQAKRFESYADEWKQIQIKKLI